MKKLLYVFALLVFVVCARADVISTSKSQIDWSSLTISGDITWSSKGTQLWVYAMDDTGEDSISKARAKWINTSISSELSSAYSYADTNDNCLSGSVYASADSTAVIFPEAQSDAYRCGDFIANSDGYVQFSANYEIWQQLFTEYAGELASGISVAGLSLSNDSTSGYDDDDKAFENQIYDGDSLTDSAAGIFTVSVWFNAGDTGFFEAWASDEAMVAMGLPEPATVCLLSIGSLILLHRKK